MSAATETLPITVSVDAYGFCVFGFEKNSAYEAARRGEIPTIEYGLGPKVKRLRVPVRRGLAQIAGNDQAMFEALSRDFLARFKIFQEAKAKRRVTA